tara:strand:- start:233 stop:373 length:141 start_codon:yes stop_codon:yes gene_type:complete
MARIEVVIAKLDALIAKVEKLEEKLIETSDIADNVHSLVDAIDNRV